MSTTPASAPASASGSRSASASASASGIYRRLLAYLRPHVGLVVAGFFATLAFAALDAFSFVMLIPFLRTLFDPEQAVDYSEAGEQIGWILEHTIGQVVQPGLSRGDMLLRVNLFILGIFALKNLFDFLQTYIVVRLEQSVVRDLRNQVYRHLIELDLRFFGRTRGGQIVSRLVGDVDQLRLMLTKNLFKLLTSIFQVIILIGSLLLISVRLTVVALVVLPMLFGVWGRILKRLRRGDRTVLDLAAQVTSHLQETTGGVRQVKAAAAEHYEADRFRALTQRYFKAHVRNERVRALASPLSEMIGALGTVLLLWYGARMVLIEGSIEAATFIGFLALSLKMYQPAKWLSKFPSLVGPGVVGAERIFEFLDTPIEMVDRPGARRFDGVREAIRFEHVGFSYAGGEMVLRAISFAAQAGQVVALVGPSGAGKTTLVDLVARFYDPTEGRITIDGIDLREYGIRSFRERLGIVTQESFLFHDTVRANIAYAIPDASQEAIEAAARAANAHEFVMQLPEGYDTVLGERGTRLSGGQRQRIAIARAILRDPPVLILDEATSALDSESERLVQGAIEQLLAGRTVFVIAHRLSTVRHADQILVLREGRIVQRGTHEALIAEGGLYAHLHRLQFRDDVDVADDALSAAFPHGSR